MYCYAQINEEGIVIGYSELSGEVTKDDLIPVEQGFDLANKKWNGSAWEDYTPPEPPAPEPDKLDLILEEVRKSSADIVSETEAAYDTALNEAYREGVNSL